jgi:hypothetical protein
MGGASEIAMADSIELTDEEENWLINQSIGETDIPGLHKQIFTICKYLS